MKLMQKMSPSRTYGGVTFPRGVPVEIPPSLEPEARVLIACGWELVTDPAPIPVSTDPVVLVSDDAVPVDGVAPRPTVSRRGHRFSSRTSEDE